MQNIPYVDIEVEDCHDEAVAKANADYVLAGDERMRKDKEDGVVIWPSRYLKVVALGTKVAKFSMSTIDASSIDRMFRAEHKHRDATGLMAGRILLPSHDGGEEGNGILFGIE